MIKMMTSEIDEKNRQFIWKLFPDGSAMTTEITRWCSDAARSTKETYREVHPAGSEWALTLARMFEKNAFTLVKG